MQDGRVVLGVDDATAALAGSTIDRVEFVQGENEDADYMVIHFGDFTLYASAPTVYGPDDDPVCIECGGPLDCDPLLGVCGSCIAHEFGNPDAHPHRTRYEVARAVREYDRNES